MVISRVIIRVTPFRALITLLITYLLSPLPLQVRAPSEFLSAGAAEAETLSVTESPLKAESESSGPYLKDHGT